MITNALFWLLATACSFVQPPVSGPIVEDFDLSGGLEGHWGVDYPVFQGEPVRAGRSGKVTFAGEVNHRISVTVDLGGGLRSTVSYLEEVAVEVGDRVSRGQILGWASGTEHDGTVHWSIRVDSTYLDPKPWADCGHPLRRGLRLLPPDSQRSSYHAVDAASHFGRYIRPTPLGASDDSRGGIPYPGSGEDMVLAHRFTLAERSRRIGDRT